MYHNTMLMLQHYRDISWALECFPAHIAEELDRPMDDLDALLSNRFGDFLNKAGMEAMGFDIGSLLGGIDLSQYSAVSAQFELNLSVSQMIQTANGVQMSQFDFSLKLDFQYFSASAGGANPFATTGASKNPGCCSTASTRR